MGVELVSICYLFKGGDSNFEVIIFPFFCLLKLLVTIITVFKRYPCTYCLMQGSCFICSDFI